MKRKNTLNNIMLDNQRRTPLYQAVITDLAITGNIDLDDAEMLLGYKIPNYLKAPDGTTIDTYGRLDDLEKAEPAPAPAETGKSEKPSKDSSTGLAELRKKIAAIKTEA